MDLHIVFIMVMALVIAFLFVDVTGGKPPSDKMKKIYAIVFILSGIAALISYLLN